MVTKPVFNFPKILSPLSEKPLLVLSCDSGSACCQLYMLHVLWAICVLHVDKLMHLLSAFTNVV